MNSFVDDPRLTAYALGEVDEAERAEVESLLKRSPDARRWVESVQQTSARLSAELKEELQVTGYELRAGNDELRITNVELNSDSMVEASSSTIDNRHQPPRNGSTIDNTARKRHRIVRLIPFALAASVAVASGVTYVVWNQARNDEASRLTCTNCSMSQVGRGLGQYMYDYSPTIPTVALADSTESKQGDVASNMQTGLVQVTPAADKQEVGAAVRTEPFDSNTVTPAGTLVLSNTPAQSGAEWGWTAETWSASTPWNWACATAAIGPTGCNMVVVPITGDESVTFSDGVTARVINSSAVAMNRPQVVGMSPGRSGEAVSSGAELGQDAVFRFPLVPDAVETMDYDPSSTGAVSPEDFALAVDSLDGINDSGRLSGTRFTLGGYDAIDQDGLGRGMRAADSSPQIGLKAKPNMDLRSAAVRDQMYAQQRGTLIEVPENIEPRDVGTAATPTVVTWSGSKDTLEIYFEDAPAGTRLNGTQAALAPGSFSGTPNAQSSADPVSFRGVALKVNAGGGDLNPSEIDALTYVPGGLGCYPDLPTNQTSQVSAEFKGDPFFGGNWLTGGNFDGTHVVSVEDYGALVSSSGAKHLIPQSNPELISIRGAKIDFRSADNISFGYQVPFGPPGAEPSTTKAGAIFYGFNPANAGEVEAGKPATTMPVGYTPAEKIAEAIRRFQEQEVEAGVPGIAAIEKVKTLYFYAPNCGFCRKNVPHAAHSVDPTTAESYDPVIEIPFLFVENQPLSTFSIDVDTASYTNVRRMLNQNVLPPHGAVRVEEMINYFDYDYPPPTGADPFSVNVAVAECPWNPEHRLARIGIKGKVFTDRNRPAVNLVFLVDVSGSMQDANKLPLVRNGLRAMVEQLTPRDSVAIVTYADGSNVALPATSARNKQTILDAVDRLMSGGGTNGGAGIETAYQLANEHYVEGGANRVILATDGDFNVGVTRQDELVSMIEEKAATGVFLSVLGFGMGNIKDSMLEKLADKGNGLYAYIDDDVEAERVLVDQMGGTLVTIAKDVKIQVEFNPAEVGAYRLIGFENRMLRAQDFNNDAKDAGEIGAGHTVTALYEIVPAGMQAHEPGVDPLKYQGDESRAATRDEVPGDDTDMVEVDEDESAEEVEDAESVVEADGTEATEPRPQGSGQRIVEGHGENTADGGQSAPYTGELMTVKLRYKDPEGDVSKLIELPVTDEGLTIDDASDDFVFAASVASFGMMLRGSAHTPGLSFDSVLEMAKSSMGEDPFGYREEFIQLVEKAKALSSPGQQ